MLPSDDAPLGRERAKPRTPSSTELPLRARPRLAYASNRNHGMFEQNSARAAPGRLQRPGAAWQELSARPAGSVGPAPGPAGRGRRRWAEPAGRGSSIAGECPPIAVDLAVRHGVCEHARHGPAGNPGLDTRPQCAEIPGCRQA